MKKLQKISSFLISLGLLIGILTISTIHYQYQAHAQLAVCQDDVPGEESDVPTSTVELKSLEAVTSIQQMMLAHHFFLLQIIPDSTVVNDIRIIPDRPSFENKVLKILFRLIISPNAP